MAIGALVDKVERERLAEAVGRLATVRHGRENYAALEATAQFVAERLAACGLTVESRPVAFHGRPYRNLVATLAGADPARERLLVGAHYDSPCGAPVPTTTPAGWLCCWRRRGF